MNPIAATWNAHIPEVQSLVEAFDYSAEDALAAIEAMHCHRKPIAECRETEDILLDLVCNHNASAIKIFDIEFGGPIGECEFGYRTGIYWNEDLVITPSGEVSGMFAPEGFAASMDHSLIYAPTSSIFAVILCLLIQFQDPFSAEDDQLGPARAIWETIQTLVSDPKYMPPYEFLLQYD